MPFIKININKTQYLAASINENLSELESLNELQLSKEVSSLQVNHLSSFKHQTQSCLS